MSRFSAGWALCTRLAFSAASQPYVAFEDYAHDRKATVMHFDAPAGIPLCDHTRFNVYPDPAATTLSIDLVNNSGCETSVTIENLNGIVLFETLTSQKTMTINIRHYPSGIYFVRIKNQYSAYTSRFLKSNVE